MACLYRNLFLNIILNKKKRDNHYEEVRGFQTIFPNELSVFKKRRSI